MQSLILFFFGLALFALYLLSNINPAKKIQKYIIITILALSFLGIFLINIITNISVLNKENNNTRDDLQKKVENKIESKDLEKIFQAIKTEIELNRKITKLDQESKGKNEEINILTKKLETNQKKLDLAKTINSKNADEISKLKKEIASQKKQIANLTTKEKANRGLIDSLNQQLNTVKKQNKELKEYLNILDSLNEKSSSKTIISADQSIPSLSSDLCKYIKLEGIYKSSNGNSSKKEKYDGSDQPQNNVLPNKGLSAITVILECDDFNISKSSPYNSRTFHLDVISPFSNSPISFKLERFSKDNRFVIDILPKNLSKNKQSFMKGTYNVILDSSLSFSFRLK